jgi:hypothetical protein
LRAGVCSFETDAGGLRRFAEQRLVRARALASLDPERLAPDLANVPKNGEGDASIEGPVLGGGQGRSSAGVLTKNLASTSISTQDASQSTKDLASTSISTQDASQSTKERASTSISTRASSLMGRAPPLRWTPGRDT